MLAAIQESCWPWDAILPRFLVLCCWKYLHWRCFQSFWTGPCCYSLPLTFFALPIACAFSPLCSPQESPKESLTSLGEDCFSWHCFSQSCTINQSQTVLHVKHILTCSLGGWTPSLWASPFLPCAKNQARQCRSTQCSLQRSNFDLLPSTPWQIFSLPLRTEEKKNKSRRLSQIILDCVLGTEKAH